MRVAVLTNIRSVNRVAVKSHATHNLFIFKRSKSVAGVRRHHPLDPRGPRDRGQRRPDDRHPPQSAAQKVSPDISRSSAGNENTDLDLISVEKKIVEK